MKIIERIYNPLDVACHQQGTHLLYPELPSGEAPVCFLRLLMKAESWSNSILVLMINYIK